MKQLVPLLTLALTAPSAMASSPNDIWSYQDSNGITLAKACNNKSTCELLYKNSHYLALVNNRSQTGCAIGDLLVAEHASRSFKKLETGTCSPSASIEVNTYNHLNNIDVMVGDRLIKRYPLDTWMYMEERKKGNVVSWKKAEENAKKQPVLIEEPVGHAEWQMSNQGTQYDLFQGVNLLTLKCSRQFERQESSSHPTLVETTTKLVQTSSSLVHTNGKGSQFVDAIEVDGKRLSAKVTNQAQWTDLVSTLLAASKVTAYKDETAVAIWKMKPVQLQTPCEYYRG
ncbi:MULTISPECIES: hypothetical protein [Aeromonas]|uniref:DUF1176 domain-containing protein n=1 Tax=Aeromonas simiae TaxID=218936 RepID=A0A5J6X026_9GAMM|nr:hypothetical protein [Aeromonas simiae]QFI55697.1 hypothetical protein FE240_13935 [Aeromonas simiae]